MTVFDLLKAYPIGFVSNNYALGHWFFAFYLISLFTHYDYVAKSNLPSYRRSIYLSLVVMGFVEIRMRYARQIIKLNKIYYFKAR